MHDLENTGGVFKSYVKILKSSPRNLDYSLQISFNERPSSIFRQGQ